MLTDTFWLIKVLYGHSDGNHGLQKKLLTGSWQGVPIFEAENISGKRNL